MSKNVQIFNNIEFGSLGILIINGKEYFAATECAKILGYSDPYDAINRHTKGSVKHRVLTPGGKQEVKFIPEGDLYRLIVSSKLPAAERFEKWLFDEVLPQIRQTGHYSLTPALPQTYEEALVALLEKVRENNAMKPKAEFFDAVAGSKDAIDMQTAAKLLYEELGLGRNKLFKELRRLGILTDDNIPYQDYIDAGYFRTIEQKYMVKNEVRINIKTLVYQKGLNFIRKKLKENSASLLKKSS